MNQESLIREVKFRTARSSGAGGQNVNKVETKVDLLFDVSASNELTDEEKERLKIAHESLINKDGLLIISSQKTRSQLANKEDAIAKFILLVEEGIKPPKKRKKVKPLKAEKEKRLKDKKLKSEKKSLRKNPLT